jgi:hypothetical protein
LQVSPDEIKANSLNIVPESQPFVEQATHVHIIGDHAPRYFPVPACKAELAPSDRRSAEAGHIEVPVGAMARFRTL